MLEVQLATAMLIGAEISACGSQSQNLGYMQEQGIVTSFGQTDDNGSISLQAGSNTFSLNFIDSIDHKPVPGILVLLNSLGSQGFFRAYDPSNTFVATLGGVQADGSGMKTTGKITQGLTGSGSGSNVMIDKTDGVCDVNNVWNELYSNNALQRTFPEQILNDSNWQKKFLEPFPITVKLSDLDDSIGETVKTAVGGEISDKAIKGILSFIIGAKNANAALGVLGPVAMISDVCSILEMKSWAMYYRSLCYSDDDTFLIYRVKSFLSTVGDIGITLPGDVRLSLIDTPQIIVLPTEVKNTDWQISAGRIYGGVLYRDGQDWKEDNVAKVSFYNPKLGTSRVEVDKTGRYSFIANACGPDKSYEVGALGRYDDWNNLPVAQTNVSVQTGNGYEVLFYLDDLGCTSKYHTYITNDDPILSPHHMAVACMIPPGANQNQPCKTLNSSSLGCMDMTLSDGKIACSGDTTTNPGSTLIYDTATGETRKGPGDNFGVHCNSPILKGGKLVCYTGTIVNIYDLSNDTLIYSIPNSYNPVDGTRYFQDLSIWGNSLVFRGSKNLNGDDDLYLTTLGETAIQDLGKIGHQPYIFNGRIAYTALSDPTNIEGSGEIRVYDSASSSNYLVGNKNGQEPRIDGNNIVYSYLEDDLSKEALQYSLQVVDISNLSQPKINVIAQGTIGMSYLNSYGYTDAYSIVRNYGVSGDYIAYLDPSTASAVQLYNISNGVTTTIYNGRVNGSGHVLGTTNSNYPSVQISGRDIIISPHESSWLICKF